MMFIKNFVRKFLVFIYNLQETPNNWLGSLISHEVKKNEVNVSELFISDSHFPFQIPCKQSQFWGISPRSVLQPSA